MMQMPLVSKFLCGDTGAFLKTQRHKYLCPDTVNICLFNLMITLFKTVQIKMDLSEYGGNKKAVQTDGLHAKHQN
jgi:hypothetical protein